MLQLLGAAIAQPLQVVVHRGVWGEMPVIVAERDRPATRLLANPDRGRELILARLAVPVDTEFTQVVPFRAQQQRPAAFTLFQSKEFSGQLDIPGAVPPLAPGAAADALEELPVRVCPDGRAIA